MYEVHPQDGSACATFGTKEPKYAMLWEGSCRSFSIIPKSSRPEPHTLNPEH